MKQLTVDKAKFKVVGPTHKPNKVLAKQLEAEYKIEVVFLKKLSKDPHNVAFVLDEYKDKIFIRYDLDAEVFHYTAFHEIRHILQGRQGSYILYRGPKNNKQGDVVRYLFDCLSCELDADMFAIRECAARQLDSCRPHYLGSSKKSWVKFLWRYAKEGCDPYVVSRKQVRAIVHLLFHPMRLKRIS